MDVADAAAASTSNDEAIPGDPTLHALLTSVSLGHLSTELCNQSVGELSVLARPDLLTRLKVCGVAKLTERQKLATALAKERKRAACRRLDNTRPHEQGRVVRMQQSRRRRHEGSQDRATHAPGVNCI